MSKGISHLHVVELLLYYASNPLHIFQFRSQRFEDKLTGTAVFFPFVL